MAHHRVNPYPGARRHNETEMFSDHNETRPLIAAVSAPSVACSMLAVHNRKDSVANSSTCPRHDELPHDEARSVDRPGILATDVRRSEIYSREAVCLPCLLANDLK